MYCNKCGHEIIKDSKFCEHCGNPINNTSSKSSKSANEPVATAVSILLAIICIGVAIYTVSSLLYKTNQKYEKIRKDNEVFFNSISFNCPNCKAYVKVDKRTLGEGMTYYYMCICPNCKKSLSIDKKDYMIYLEYPDYKDKNNIRSEKSNTNSNIQTDSQSTKSETIQITKEPNETPEIVKEPYEPLGIFDTSGINGIYTDREYALEMNNGEGGSYNSYRIQNGKIEYWEEYTIYQGTYVQKDNKLIITYTRAYYGEQPEKLDIYSDELTIVSDNKLIKNELDIFIKE